jgi:hypothetical protein
MMMIKKRTLLLLPIASCVLIAAQADGISLKRLLARHVKETVFISAGNRHLAGFFDGLNPDPRWDALKVRQATRAVQRCGANRGLLSRVAALLERTVYANGCSTICGGFFYNKATSSCPGCTDYNYLISGFSQCSGGYQDGSNGCGGGAGCPNQCNSDVCRSPGCSGCAGNGSSCTGDGDCCSGNCFEGACGG